MKKSTLLWSMIAIIFIVLLSVIIFMIYNPINNKKEKSKGINYVEMGKYIDIEQIPQNYSFDQALKDGCFIISYKQVYNNKQLEEFINNTKMSNKNRTSDIIRIIQYTREGDMLITDVCYQKYQNRYVIVTDNTRDKFAESSNKKIVMNNNLPGNSYEMIKTEDGDYTKLVLSTTNKQELDTYKNYEIASYLKIAKINETGPNFIGIVEKVNGKAVLVKTEDTEIKDDNDRYSFTISEKQVIELKEGDKVLVIYTGLIHTTYPIQIEVMEIQKVE